MGMYADFLRDKHINQLANITSKAPAGENQQVIVSNPIVLQRLGA